MNLQRVPIRELEYQDKVEIPKEFYLSTDILDIRNVFLNFSIVMDNNQEFVLHLQCHGLLILQDARTLESRDYPFDILFDEKITEESEICGRFLENSQNTLDILTILWENIVLEIPISYTESDELNFEGEGYKVSGNMSGENIDPRLAPLLELLDKEKE